MRRLLNRPEIAYAYDDHSDQELLDMYHDLWSVRANIDFYEIYTTQLLPSYKSITDNINRLKNKLTPK